MKNGNYEIIGTRPVRHDGIDKVTGRAVYGADVRLPKMLYGKVKRSPYAHAKIVSIDCSKALEMPGVKAVATADDLVNTVDRMSDIGETVVNTREIAQNSLASDKVLYKGHSIAAVAATSPHIAEEALDLIQVEYDPLPPVIDVLEAMSDDAPLLDEKLTTRSMGEDSKKPSNIASHNQYKIGNPEKQFVEADVIVEREFRTATVHQGYIEPHNTTVYWREDGTVTVWVSTQGPFQIRDQLADVLQIPVSKIKVIPTEIGGGFGAKFPIYMEPAAAVMSQKTRCPVKMVMTRTEEFEATGPAPGSYIKVKMGATNDGKIVAAEAYLAYEAGAYPGSAVGAGAMCIFSPYNIDSLIIDAYDVVVNKPKSTAYRAPGAPNAAFAAETVIDELAEKLDLDPLQFRLANGAEEGTRRADSVKFSRIGCKETVQAAIDSDHYQSQLIGPNRGRGIASGYWMNGGGQSAATLSVNPNGTVNLLEGSADIGGSRASMAIIVAETLGIKADDVNPQVVDTDSVGFTDGTGGSRVTYATGHACYLAATELKEKMIERAAQELEVDKGAIVFDEGRFIDRNNNHKNLSFKEVASNQRDTGGPLTADGAVNAEGPTNGFATHIVDVEVDPETGKVEILRYTAVQDVGTAIHPSYVEGQLQGGVAQGIGWALNEEFYFNKDGSLANTSFLDYRMPTPFDVPMIETILVEVPNPLSPHGIRGVGEVPIVPPLAAIANAVYHAVGERVDTLPITPARLSAAMGSRK
ncbi:MAG: Caffeine dehydrogenase subunit alpha [Candidatus Moanabacter tarae]|uniref:Caffeine dehydrogenase subunit alpha n=1 Tax=Candidatus Moanibacter tarae TaxID=2200854 RepID=A0A2Z4AI56_9BACT|nr:MAG: Caffeine dehydrogenase subunit alpha [Candidatus Moanabacter tarae]|tara:strand:+ start:851 stop:3106 length:2256 start_codon:yes stop_codon:yes gene_type:complete